MTNQAVGLNNYATGESSRYPELWRGCIGAWAPFLGASGSRQHDLSRSRAWQNATSLPTYDLRDGVNAIVGNPTISATTPAHFLSLTEATFFCWVYKSAQGDNVSAAPLTGANNSRFGMQWAGDGTLYSIFEGDGNSNFASRSLTGAGSKLVGAQYKAGLSNATWVNGIKVTHANFAPTTLRTTASTSSLTTDGFSSTSANGAIFAMMFWNRRLSDNEMALISRVGIKGLFERRSSRRVNTAAAALNAIYATRQTQLIGGGLL